VLRMLWPVLVTVLYISIYE